MKKHQARNISLGILVISGTVVLILGLYFIGSKQNIFGNTLRVSVNFRNVNGLMAGHNVRYAGIDIGTVENVEILSDSGVNATLLIDKNSARFIRKNSQAAIGTDGLMGNKLVNIEPSNDGAPEIADGDVLPAKKQIETDEVFRTLNQTNDDVSVIMKNLRLITEKVNSSNTIWSMLLDPEVSRNLKEAIVNVKITSEKSALLTGDLSQVIKDIRNGKGVAGTLLTDPGMQKKMEQTIVNINYVSDTLVQVSGDLSRMMKQMNNKEGAMGTLLLDTAFANNLKQSMRNINTGAKGFSDNMEALKQNKRMQKYYERQAKAKK